MNNCKIAALFSNLACAFALAVAALPAQAAVPQTLNYQGQLTNAAGVPVNGLSPVNMTFSLYTVPTGVSPVAVWSETQPVTVTNGLYSVSLGQINPLTPALFTAPLYLGISVGADPEMTPRIALGSSATALRAAVADSLGSNVQTSASPTNTLLGVGAGNATMTGTNNTASGAYALYSNTTGSNNTASGAYALPANTTGSGNTASGYSALFANTTGYQNTASGEQALNFNTTGYNNTASGAYALYANTTGYQNTASGVNALFFNTTGNSNTASGYSALSANTTGVSNTAVGTQALYSNTTGNNNTASGLQSLYFNTIGNYNSANSLHALYSNTTGNNNTASGTDALFSNTTGGFNIALGSGAGYSLTTGSYNIDIGNAGVAAEASTIRIGDVQTRAFIAGIRGVTTGVANAIPVVIDGSGQLGTVSSSRRFKDDIADMSDASSLLMKLRPVTFTYKADKGPTRALQYGLIAEEVAAIAPGLVAHSADGQIETVFYQFLTPMLLNEYQKQQRTIEAQAAALTRQTARIAELENAKSLQEARLTRMESRVQLLLTQALAEKQVASR